MQAIVKNRFKNNSHKVSRMRTNISYVIIFLVCVFVTASCEKVEKINTLGETEYCFDERLSSLSSGADSIVWVGGETGALWRLRGDERRVYDIGEDRIYKVVSEKKRLTQRDLLDRSKKLRLAEMGDG